MKQFVELVYDYPVVTIALNRPESHNAFNPELIAELAQAFQTVGQDQAVRVVVLRGRGRNLCAGADVNIMRAAAEFTFAQNVADGQAIFDLMEAVDSCPTPGIGRINGAAICGGARLVSCCDIVVAVQRATFAFSEVRLGIVLLLTTFIFFRKWFSVFPASARLLFYALAAVGVSLIFWKSNAADRLMAGSYEDSLAYKIDYLLGYIEYASNRNFNSLVFGNGFLAELVPTHAFAVRGKDFGFDSDVGYMIYYLGIPWSGFFLLFLIYWFLVNREYFFAAPILLWMISSSIFFNVRSAMLFAGMVLVFKMLGPRGVRV